jgi:Protein of unknown function (DUF1269)
MSLDLAVMVYPGIDDADHAFADAAVAAQGAPWLAEAAVVQHHGHDRISIRGTVSGHYVDADDEGDFMGTTNLDGALTGGVVGIAFGPLGIATGLVAGGVIGGEVEAHESPHIHSALFEEMRADVPEKSSAVVLLAAPEHVDAMVEALGDKHHGQLTRRSLDDQTVAALEQAVASAPLAGPE